MALPDASNDRFYTWVLVAAALGVVGAVAGTLGALGLTELLTSLLYGVSTKDPLTFSAVPVVLMAVAFIACAVPARAATRVDPIRALRYD